MGRCGKRTWAAVALCGALLVGTLAGCGESGAESGAAASATAAAEETAVPPEILVVSFGTSYNDSRERTIGGIEGAIAESFPDYEVKRAFTSQTIIDKLKSRDGIDTMNVREALEDAAARGVRTLVVQPTHLMDGYEYTDLKDELSDYAGRFDRLCLGEPLLMSDEDFQKVATAIAARTEGYLDGKTAVCFMGHGTEADSNRIYADLQEVLRAGGHEDLYVGTVEASPTVEDLLAAVGAKGSYTRVVLEPLMVVAGDHANNDMAGDAPDSWKSIFQGAGYEVECVLEGLGEDHEIQSIYVDHVRAAISAA